MARHAYDCLWYQSGNYSYLLRVAGRSDCAPAHCFMSIFKMRRKFWPRTMTTHLNMLKHLNKEIRRGKQTCKQAGKETSKNASVTKQTWGAKVETAIRKIRFQSNIFKTRNPYSQYMQTVWSLHASPTGSNSSDHLRTCLRRSPRRKQQTIATGSCPVGHVSRIWCRVTINLNIHQRFLCGNGLPPEWFPLTLKIGMYTYV